MYRVTRNGYEVEWFDTDDEMEEYIAGALEEHADLDPQLIFRHYGSSTTEGEVSKGHICSMAVYRYRTIYTEMFMIEELR